VQKLPGAGRREAWLNFFFERIKCKSVSRRPRREVLAKTVPPRSGHIERVGDRELKKGMVKGVRVL